MKTGFYCPVQKKMLGVEVVDLPRSHARDVAALLRQFYRAGSARVLSGTWVVWDREKLAVFPLTSTHAEQPPLDEVAHACASFGYVSG